MNVREILIDILDSGIEEFNFDLTQFIDKVVDNFFKVAKLHFPYTLFKGKLKSKLEQVIISYYNELKKGTQDK